MVVAADSWTSTMKNSIMVFLYNENCFDNDDEINFVGKIDTYFYINNL